jgi:hypothetical protein
MAKVWGVLVGAMLLVGSGGVVFADRIDDTPGATVFLNRHGGVYRPGFDNAATNTSPIISGTRAVPPFAGDDDDWQDIVNRVRARFAPFDISIVDVEPAPPLRYIEAVVGGTPAALGFPSNVLGVSPVYCRPAATSIVFVFAALIPGDNTGIATTIVHEVGHAFSLDHEVLCKSPMGYVEGCGEKVFQHRTSACGEFTERPCICGAADQNAFDILIDAFGSRDGRLKPVPAQAASEAAEPVAMCTLGAAEEE